MKKQRLASHSSSSSSSQSSSEEEGEGEASAAAGRGGLDAAAKRPGCCNKEHECCVAVYTIDKHKDDAIRKVRGVMRK